MLIIQHNEISELARPISKSVDKNRVNAFIREAEDMDLLPTIGIQLLNDIRNNPEKYVDLLEGCEFTEGGETSYHSGLKRALAYYAYARMVQNGDGQVTRYGYVEKTDQYSDQIDNEQRGNAYRSAFEMADTYMAQVLRYIEASNISLYNKDGKVRNSRVKYRIIGE